MVPAHDASHGVAIIGFSCRLPGAHDKEAFWTLLREGRDAVAEIPAQRWRTSDADAPRWAGLIEGVDQFDAAFFEISPREAQQLDPQQRLLLQEAWHCIEDAGIAPSALRAARTAVFAGAMAADYRERLIAAGVAPESFSFLGNAAALLANRLSHVFGFRGESKTVDAACASSLVALHDARRALEAGEADFALVAAANVLCHPWKHDSFGRAHMLSPTGRCRTFSAAADGYVPGEGAAVLLLERLPDALRAGRRIHGVLRGSAVNHCGASLTVTSPSIAAQRDVIRAALRSAGVDATAVSYVEAHGTGTSLGDPIEIEALRQALQPEAGAPSAPAGSARCRVGAVKTNIGHLEAAAGLAGVIKVLLMFRACEIPPSLHGGEPNPIIDFSRLPFDLATRLEPWTVAPGARRRAGVSSFGFGGVNAHVVLEEPPVVATKSAPAGRPAGAAPLPFLLSARSEPALRDLIAAWRAHAESPEFAAGDLAAVSATLARGRESGPWRAGGLVQTQADVRRLLTGLAPQRSAPVPAAGLILGEATLPPEALAAWLAQDENLAAAFHRFTAALAAGADVASGAARTFAFHCAFAARVRELGFSPGWIAGAGAGRYAALVAAGVFEPAAAWRLAQGAEPGQAPRRPQCRVYGFGPRPLSPRVVTAGELAAWCADVVPETDARSAFATAASLIAAQPTFARFMREWEPLLAAGDVTAQLTAGGVADNAARLRLFVVVQASLRRLSRKWELPERDLPFPGAHALTEFLVTGALEPRDFLRLFAAEAPLETIAAAVNSRLALASAGEPARIAGVATDDIVAQLRDAGTSVAPTAWPADFAVTVGLGSPSRPDDLPVALEGSPADGWLNVLVTLWQRGVAVDWSEWFGRAAFTPAAVPAYPFERKSYWVDLVASPSPAPLPTPTVVAAPGRIALRSPVSVRPSATPATPSLPAVRPQMATPSPSSVRVVTAERVASANAILPWEVRDGVAVLHLAERTEHNAFTDELIAAFETRLAQIAADPGVRVVVVGNAGAHFCAGGTTEFIDQLRRGERTFADLGCFYRGLLECPVPVINAVAGHAFGGGLAFALFGDVVVLAAESRYSANFLSLGFSPGMGATLIVPEKLGADVGARLLYSGQTLSGRELAEAGARVQVIAKTRVWEAALELARDFARQSRVALEVLKRQMAAPLLARLDGHVERELAGHQVTLVDAAAQRGAQPLRPVSAGPSPTSDVVLSAAAREPGVAATLGIAANVAPQLPVPSVAAVPAAASVPPSESPFLPELQALAGKLLLMRAEEVDPTRPFRELGMDSVLTVELAKAISRKWPVTIDAAVLYEHPSVARLAEHLQSLVAPPSSATAAPAAAVVTAASVTSSSSAAEVAVAAAPEPAVDGIAIIGMSGRFPGADSIDAFWHNLAAGVDSVTPVPSNRWDADAVFAADPDVPGKTNSRWGGFLRDIDAFDPLFFKIPPSEAEAMDPQQRLFLEESWRALEHAGYGGLRAARCGVFVGVAAGDYADHLAQAGRGDSAEAFLGLAPSILAARISYLLDLRGPSLAIDTACSSSLVAIHQACQSLRAGECGLALAGGVTLMTTPQLHLRAGRARMLSPTGRCRPFGEEADGIALGEGVGVVVLKPLAQARTDGDTIYGVIRGSAINQDGATNGITAPSARAQEELIRDVLRRADVALGSLQLIEAHGTGTALGDPIELRALTAAFQPEHPSPAAPRCALGSVKSNIGHTVCAAGVAGLIKVLLALRHRAIPPSLHFGSGNPRVRFADTPFFVPTQLTPWKAERGPRRAAVSSFGFSGTNAHVIVEEPAPDRNRPGRPVPAGPHRFTLSAQTPAALARYVEAWRQFVQRSDADLPELADVAFTLATGRARMTHVFSISVRDYAELRAALASFVPGNQTAADRADDVPPPGRRVALPTYPFERVRCWALPATPPTDAVVRSPAVAPASAPTRDDALEQLLERLSRDGVSIQEAEAEIARRELLPR